MSKDQRFGAKDVAISIAVGFVIAALLFFGASS